MPAGSRQLPIKDVLQASQDYLSTRKIPDARLNAEYLLAHLLDLNRIDLYLNYDRPLNKKELATYKVLLKRRLNQEPLQYIIGQSEFFSLPFKVDTNVLIPRPETEILVEAVIDYCREKKSELSILEIGTGSGCIAIALASTLPNARIVAIDKSEKAVEVATENARLNEVADKVDFCVADFCEDCPGLSGSFDIIVSNPPYVSAHDYSNLPEEIKGYEPQSALTDHADGLSFYKRIANAAGEFLRPDGLVAVEIGAGQAEAVKKLFLQNDFTTVNIKNDLNGIERVICSQ